MKAAEKIGLAGFAWYRPETYARIREISNDRRNLPIKFETWERQANRRFAQFAAQGITVEKVFVDPEELLAWCNGQARPVDRYSRAEYAGRLVFERDKQTAGVRRDVRDDQ